jgi:hypothetical protein
MARFTEELSACENKRALEPHMERKRHFCEKKKKNLRWPAGQLWILTFAVSLVCFTSLDSSNLVQLLCLLSCYDKPLDMLQQELACRGHMLQGLILLDKPIWGLMNSYKSQFKL